MQGKARLRGLWRREYSSPSVRIRHIRADPDRTRRTHTLRHRSPSVRIRHIRADPWSIPAIQGEARLRQAMAGYVFKDHGAGR
jgi:hypothetical protein